MVQPQPIGRLWMRCAWTGRETTGCFRRRRTFSLRPREETSHQQRSGARQGIIGNAEHAGFPWLPMTESDNAAQHSGPERGTKPGYIQDYVSGVDVRATPEELEAVQTGGGSCSPSRGDIYSSLLFRSKRSSFHPFRRVAQGSCPRAASRMIDCRCIRRSNQSTVRMRDALETEKR